MATAHAGHTVHVHYTGRLADGTVFDSSEGGEPLVFTLGEGEVIAGFDDGVTGMAVGDTKTIEVPAAEGYGARREDLVLPVPRAQFPPEIAPEVGQQLELGMDDGGSLPVTITQVKDDVIVLDANHPLAGKTLLFDLELVGIED